MKRNLTFDKGKYNKNLLKIVGSKKRTNKINFTKPEGD